MPKARLFFVREVVGQQEVTKDKTVKDAGGGAMILMSDKDSGYSILADAYVLPASHVSY
jgi:hypothetical protein